MRLSVQYEHMEIEPIQITRQVQDGCVTASARSFISHLGVPFDSVFLPRLQEYSLDHSNPENNHMLGVAVVASELGLATTIHRAIPLEGDILPDNAPARAKLIHPKVVEQIRLLQEQGKITVDVGKLDLSTLTELLKHELGEGKYGLILLDWDKWNSEAQKKYGNPRHIVAVIECDNTSVKVIDPSLENTANPSTQSIDHLFQSLNDKQQMIFLGKKV